MSDVTWAVRWRYPIAWFIVRVLKINSTHWLIVYDLYHHNDGYVNADAKQDNIINAKIMRGEID